MNAWILTLGGHSVPSTSFSLSIPSHLSSSPTSSLSSISLALSAYVYLSPLFPLADVISTTGPASVHLVIVSRAIFARSSRLRERSLYQGESKRPRTEQLVNIRARSITLRGSCDAEHSTREIVSWVSHCHFHCSFPTINLLLLTFRPISDIKLFKNKER